MINHDVLQRRKRERKKIIIWRRQCVEDVGRSVGAVRDTKGGIRSAEKFISALLTGRKLNMPYWFSASRAPGGNKSSPVQTTRAHTHTHTRGPVLIFDPLTYLFARALFSETRERVYGVSMIIISERNRCTVCVHNLSGKR